MSDYKLITKGNSKLGKGPFHVNTTSGLSCPGATAWCIGGTGDNGVEYKGACYTKKFGRYPNVVAKYAANLDLWDTDPATFEALLRMDLTKIRAGSVFRWHVSGDIPDANYAKMIARIATDYPHIRFWLYTRSYRVPALLPLIVDLETNYDNLKVWRSTDESVAMQPNHRDARAFDTAAEAKAAGFVVCPEQTGRKADCESCGLCFDITKPVFRLAFVKH